MEKSESIMTVARFYSIISKKPTFRLIIWNFKIYAFWFVCLYAYVRELLSPSPSSHKYNLHAIIELALVLVFFRFKLEFASMDFDLNFDSTQTDTHYFTPFTFHTYLCTDKIYRAPSWLKTKFIRLLFLNVNICIYFLIFHLFSVMVSYFEFIFVFFSQSHNYNGCSRKKIALG